MVKIACIVLGHLSNGELTIALEFTEKLDKEKYHVTYVVPSKLEENIQKKNYKTLGLKITNGAKENYNKFAEFIEEWKPEFLLLSDIFTLEYSGTWSGVTWEKIKSMGIKTISFDEYDYKNNYTLDFMGGNSVSYPSMIEECDYRIYDCPINKQNDNEHCFMMYKDGFHYSEEERNRMAQKYRDSETEKVVLMVTSGWEFVNTGISIYVDHFIKVLPDIIMGYLSEIQMRIKLVHISPVKWAVNAPDNINYTHISYLEENEFNKMIAISDLFITTNVVSVTLTKAIYMGIPSIALYNPRKIDFSNYQDKLKTYPQWYRNMSERLEIGLPFRASVFGWTKFLEKVIHENEYMNTFISTPIYKYSDTREAFVNLLINEAFVNDLKHKQRNYIEELGQMELPNEIMDAILKEKHRIT